MTVSNEQVRETATGDGAETSFAFQMKLLNTGDVSVYNLTDDPDTALTEGVDYTVTIDAVNEGGTIDFTVAPTNLDKLLFIREMDYDQGNELPTTGSLPIGVIQTAVDRAVMLIQQVKEIADRCVYRPSTSTSTASLAMPEPSTRKAIMWNTAANALENSTYDPDTLATAAATSATAAATSATAAATSATAAATSATAAATSATAAAASEAKAADWAEEAEDVEVETGQYSALHWAAKAQAATGTLTAKGDLLSHNGTTNTRVAVGTDGYVLVPDSTAASGLAYVPFLSLFPTGWTNDWHTTTLPPGGWVWENGTTIGNAASGASQRANADTEDLFTFLWTNFSDSICPVSSGRGASAAADFAANKTIGVLDKRGRVMVGNEIMGGVTAAGRITAASTGGANAQTLGGSGGEEAVTLTTGTMPIHNHSITAAVNAINQGYGGGNAIIASAAAYSTGNAGSGGAHSNTQPWMICNKLMKL